ncbi:DUF6480 family protein [Streptomyces sp. XD-27]|uniref:DUF6480 family protein n=1 Tax=Streptomyces sp. XD-27 TaxID=3062779 RepID=UPI0026F448CF|nr:DUF6480 family protein [Streptomyces sp. XD-27]WKX73581.1 DUF6480 family protein [Streptomyces sp. XD-27]
MTEQSPDPDRSRDAGQPGAGVPPGETPPGESSMSGAGPRETYNPTKGWAKGPTVAILLLVLVFVAFCVAFIVALL